MAKKLSPRAQRLIIALGPDEAYNIGSKVLDVEHILLALLKSADGLGYFVLKAMRINVLTMQLTIEQSMTARIPNTELYDLPHSARLNALLVNAEKEADSTGSDYVGTEHLLLAAVAEEKSLVNTYFAKAGIGHSQVRQVVLDVQKKVPSSAKQDNASSFYRETGDAVPYMSDGSEQRRQFNKNGMLAHFSRDLTEEAADEDADPVIGRREEILRVIRILSRRTKNNPVLVGEPGVGKTAVVEGLAHHIVKGTVPACLLHKRILCLDLAAMIAGTKYRGEFEERLKRVMKELKENRDIILFIDEL
ncbi:MAG: ATP-dependent Clp protease ATP-binding subunit, partial [Treponema sp.]|nr:ATP-dependent Clp protease ATP-binding subunit [Treponema sp.]